MTISDIIKNMIDYSNGNRHDINHFMKVYAYAKMIGECEGLDYQILVEADYIVNADESQYSRENIENMLKQVFVTRTGSDILKSMYLTA